MGKAMDSPSVGKEETLHPKPDRQAEQNRSTPVNPDKEGYGKGSSVRGMFSRPVRMKK
jgi:hypothetical protein